MEKTLTTRETRKKKARGNPVAERIRKDSKMGARKYVEGWKVPKGAE